MKLQTLLGSQTLDKCRKVNTKMPTECTTSWIQGKDANLHFCLALSIYVHFRLALLLDSYVPLDTLGWDNTKYWGKLVTVDDWVQLSGPYISYPEFSESGQSSFPFRVGFLTPLSEYPLRLRKDFFLMAFGVETCSWLSVQFRANNARVRWRMWASLKSTGSLGRKQLPLSRSWWWVVISRSMRNKLQARPAKLTPRQVEASTFPSAGKGEGMNGESIRVLELCHLGKMFLWPNIPFCIKTNFFISTALFFSKLSLYHICPLDFLRREAR